REQELEIVENQRLVHPIENLTAVTNPEEVIEVQEAVRHVYVDDLIKQYIVAITDATRTYPDVSLGASPRGSLGLFRGGQATAIVRGRDHVLPDDIKELAVPMLSHRIIVSAAARMRGMNGGDVVAEIVEQVPVPGAQAQGWFRR
ncbi:MAG: MoxR family ATPase, partial [Chloroflexi bacterium]|nr:MoxR family ATPase [Chloroflexota bacterium]